MAKAESDFQKLLSEAPMAHASDTVTVVGALSRAADAAHFNLALPNGRTVTLDVDAVKSAKAIAGAVGQSLVQLELDAKRIPEGLIQAFKSGPDYTAAYTDYHFGPWGGPTVGNGGGSHGSVPQIEIAGDPTGALAPFVARSAHHVHPEIIAALAAFGGTRTYSTSPYHWATDQHLLVKPQVDQQ